MTGGMLRGRLGFNFFDVFIVAFVGAFAAITVYPMWYVLVVSLMPYGEFIRTDFVLLPSLTPDLTYYHGILIGAPQIFLRAMSVSIAKTAVGAGGGVVVTAMLAYAVTKRHVPGTRLINTMVVLTLFFSGGLIPLYLLVVKLGLLGSFLSLILVTAFVNTSYFIIMRNFFSYMVPKDLEDACAIDGANEATTFFRIILPIAKPMITAILLFLAVYHWNDYTSWLYFVRDTKIAAVRDPAAAGCWSGRRFSSTRAAGQALHRRCGLDSSQATRDGDHRAHHAADPDAVPVPAAALRQGHPDRRRQGVVEPTGGRCLLRPARSLRQLHRPRSARALAPS